MGMDYSWVGSASYPRFYRELCEVAKVFGGIKTEYLKEREATENDRPCGYWFGFLSSDDSDNKKFVFPDGTNETLVKWFNDIYGYFTIEETKIIWEHVSAYLEIEDISHQIWHELEMLTEYDEPSKPHKSENEIKVNRSEYARFFDECSAMWTRNPEHNLYFLRIQQNYANDLLRSRGYLFLNEVYDMLGIPKSKAGQIVGWVYDENNLIGDNMVDFGLYDECNSIFVNGYENSILLDFNVNGIILDRL